MIALSIKQPWAWLIVEGWKGIENRDWPAPKQHLGRNVLIHASKSKVRKEWDEACEFALKAGATMLPDFAEVDRGGIVGMVKLSRCVTKSSSPWFVGRFGHVFTDPYPMPFMPCIGQTGYFTPTFL